MRTLQKNPSTDEVNVDVDSLASLPHQVAGYHRGVLSNILNDSKGKICKPYKPLSNPTYGQQSEPVQPDDDEVTRADKMVPVTKNELDFYLKLKESTDDTMNQLQHLIPKFMGTIQIKDIDHLVLEDITHGFEKPCVLDLKLGKCRHYPTRPKEKIIIDNTRYPSLRETGFCIAGMKLYSVEKDDVELHLSPEVTHHFTSEDVEKHIKKYVRVDLDGSAKLAKKITQELHKILKWSQQQTSFIFRGSSILVSYDAVCFQNKQTHSSDNKHTISDTCDDSTSNKPFEPRVKMIDFAHVFHSYSSRDENYLLGLQNLVKLFEQLIVE